MFSIFLGANAEVTQKENAIGEKELLSQSERTDQFNSTPSSINQLISHGTADNTLPKLDEPSTTAGNFPAKTVAPNQLIAQGSADSVGPKTDQLIVKTTDSQGSTESWELVNKTSGN